MRIGLRELHGFITLKLPRILLRRYRKLQILNESDMQFEVGLELRKFLSIEDNKARRLEVHNCLSCSADGLKTYPDVLIMKRGKPWIVIELKEKGNLSEEAAAQEREKIHRLRTQLKAKRGYLIYVGRWGKHRRLRGPKGVYGFRFYEVAATLEREGRMSKKEIETFQRQFREKAKYVCASQNGQRLIEIGSDSDHSIKTADQRLAAL